MKGLQGVTIHEMKKIRTYFMQDYGGLPFIKLLRNCARIATFVRDLGSLLGDMKFH
jgi:hypothetical protein